MLAAGNSYSEICERLGCTDPYIGLWKERFQQERLSGLDSRYRGAAHRRRTAETEARILELTRRGPTDGSTHWSSYRLAKEVGVSQSTVSRVWRQFGSNHTGRVVIWLVMIRSSKRKRRTSSACTSNHRHMPLSSAWTRRAPSKRWIAWIRFCRSLQAALNGMASSTTAMEPFHSTAL
jgi:transposase